MNRLKFPQKFLLISLLFALPLALVMILLVLEINTSIDFAEKEKAGTAYLRPLRIFYAYALQNQILDQGLENTKITVDDIKANRTHMDQAFQSLETTDRALGVTLRTSQEFAALKTTWTSLKSQAPGDVSSVDDLDSKVIDQSRTLMSSVGETSNLIIDSKLDSYFLMDAVLLKGPEDQQLLAKTLMLDIPGMAQRGSTAGLAQTSSLASLMQANINGTQSGIQLVFRDTSSRTLQPALEKPLKDYVDAVNGFLGAGGRI